MNERRRRAALAALLLLFALTTLLWQNPASANAPAQLPTGSLPTVTSTPEGPVVVVAPNSGETQANLRSGPGILFEKVGVLLLGQRAPVVGRSPKGEWYQVLYPGAPGGKAWVFVYVVELYPPNTNLPIVEAPLEPTVEAIATIDPTLAARFDITLEAPRPATFTAPPPLNIPTFVDVSPQPTAAGVPIGMAILGLAVLGFFLGLVAFSVR